MFSRMYYRDPYCKSFGATVTKCVPARAGGYWVALTDTAFYPEGGGQPGDTGNLLWCGERIQVRDTQPQEGLVGHWTDKPLPEGAQVRGELDWEQRFRRMQNHTGEHILSGVLRRRMGAENVGFHLGKEGVQVDFHQELTHEELLWAEEEVNRCIFADIPVTTEVYAEQDVPAEKSYRCKKELTGQVRLVTVGDYDCCACCALHVGRTGEIGLVRLLRWERYKGGTRILMAAGWDAFRIFRQHSGHVYSISSLLSARPPEVTEAVERLREESEGRKHETYRWRQEAFRQKAKQLPATLRRAVVVWNGLTSEDCRQLVLTLLTGRREAVVFSPQEDGVDGQLRFAIASTEGTARELLQEMQGRFAVRGGGKPDLVQGTAVIPECDRELYAQTLMGGNGGP